MVSLGAAAIHFAVFGEHYHEYVPFGVFFAVGAWFQAMWAVAIVAVPSRRLLEAGMLANLAVVGVWVVSRSWGVPLGPGAGHPEAVSTVDLAATVLEVLIVAGGAVLIRAPARGASAASSRLTGPRSVGVAAGLVLFTVAVVTAAIPASRDHHNPTTPGDGSHHSHGVSGGEADPAQIELIRAAMARYQDIDVAYAQGWEQEHPDWPETGAHFVRETDGPEPSPGTPGLDLADPGFLMYSRIGRDDWELVAVAYVVDQALSPTPPTDIQGAAYHQHVWNCIVEGEELDEEDSGVISRDECRDREGEWSPGGVWMTHVWLIDNPAGIFAETNPNLV